MKLFNCNDEILFDTFPKRIRPFQKVFITHLFGIEADSLEGKSLPIIYTTAFLANRMKQFINNANLKVKPNFVLVQPHKPFKLARSSGDHLEVLVCEGSDLTHNLMVAMRKDKEIMHLYVGNCTDIRSVILNDTSAEWLKNGVQNLYMNLKLHSKKRSDMNEVMPEITYLIEKTIVNDMKVIIVIPIFGYENLIGYLVKNLKNRIAFDVSYTKYDLSEFQLDIYQKNIQQPKILITNVLKTKDEIREKFILFKTITIKITDCEAKSDISNGYYEMQWSPLPTSFELELLPTIIGTDRVTHIHDIGNHSLPVYLKKFHKPIPNKTTPGSRKIVSRTDQSKEVNVITEPLNVVTQQKKYAPIQANRKRVISYISDSDDDDS